MKFLFVFAAILVGFFVGVFCGISTVSEGNGLAGPAIVLGNGLMGAVLFLVLAWWVGSRLEPKVRRKITVVLLLTCLIPLGWMIYRFKTSRPTDEQSEPAKARPVTPVSLPVQTSASGLGIGIVRPDFFNKKVLYFYSPNPQKSPSDHSPSDSLTFQQTDQHQYDIAYAPPWFYPEAVKMDYEILYLKALNQTHDWIEVEVNKQTGQSTWIDTSDAEITYWPYFLLSVNSIENLYPEKNPLRVRPLLHASQWIGDSFEYMLPVMINENWIKVSLRDGYMKEVGSAWLLWHDSKDLLISYNLLS